MNIYVGYLPENFNDEQLRTKFAEFGQVVSAKVIMDRDTRQSKGFGFVEMKDNSEGQTAIDSLQSWVKEDGRRVSVNVAKEREPREFSSRW